MNTVDDLLAQAAARHGVPGAAVAVARGDELVEAATGVVNRETGVAATPGTVFQIGSVTKVWTAALVLQLVEDGLVDLDDPVRRHLPGFALPDPAATDAVTVRHLLLHTGGFFGDLFEDTGRGDDALDRYLDFVAGHAEQFAPPGEIYSYSNAGYSVLGALVARLRGGTWESVLRERLIDPLGARHMAALPEEAVLFRVAAGHLPSGEVARPWAMARSQSPAGASLCAAPRDLVRFGRAFLTGDVLSKETVERMTTPCLTLPGVPKRGHGRRGLGPEVYDWSGTTAFGHNGGTFGQGALWRVVPSHSLVVAISANGGALSPFLDEVLDGVVDLTVPGRPTPPSGPFRPGPAEFAGRYEFPLAAYEVSVAPDGLEITAVPRGVVAEMGEQPSTRRFVALSGTTFVAVEPEEGVHETLTFLEGGRYLYGGRIARRISS
ncbi:beta-lactamase family protein [Actinoplanes sp. LDG1-06]|uniref:Beta-lactamase family protein n=1 Tax=Paractinoplanes ovalisporus TaxID=2810368 RepID=A0ABS2AMJ5_9ACTN|nr:serine hydrolase domain-containing protein [Actinoplanes ovalisporus]MBM2621010.1 beta-lactamase family protein [Actinoplanes ovalisporus]